MFENEYIMDAKRFSKWTVPKFWCLPIFYIDLFIVVAGIVGLWYFSNIVASNRWRTLSIFLIFIGIYRGFLFRWMISNKQYRVMKDKYFDNKPWKVTIYVNKNSVEQSLNGKFNSKTEWEKFKYLVEAKSFFTLKLEDGDKGMKLDKDSFTKGDAESFKDYVLSEQKHIIYQKEAPMFDK